MFVISFLAFPDRFLPFAFVFGLMPLSGFIIILKKNLFKKMIVVLLISFVVFNLYTIESQNYTYNATFSGGAVSEKEYLIAKQISFPDKYFGYIAAVAAIYDVQDIVQRDGGMSLKFMVDFSNSSTMAVINEAVYVDYLENLKQKSIEEYSKIVEIITYKNQKDVDKICDLGNIYVVKGGV